MKNALMAIVVLAVAAAPAFAQAGRPPAATPADQTFVMNTAKANMAEVEFGKLAAVNASNPDVKKFAQRMVDDHSKSLTDLRALAGSKNIVLPSELDPQDKTMRDKMAPVKGEAFDREYMSMMVAGHTKVVESFRTEMATGTDADVKAWASKTLPAVEAHLKLAQDTNRAVGTSGVKK